MNSGKLYTLKYESIHNTVTRGRNYGLNFQTKHCSIFFYLNTIESVKIKYEVPFITEVKRNNFLIHYFEYLENIQ